MNKKIVNIYKIKFHIHVDIPYEFHIQESTVYSMAVKYT